MRTGDNSENRSIRRSSSQEWGAGNLGLTELLYKQPRSREGHNGELVNFNKPPEGENPGEGNQDQTTTTDTSQDTGTDEQQKRIATLHDQWKGLILPRINNPTETSKLSDAQKEWYYTQATSILTELKQLGQDTTLQTSQVNDYLSGQSS